MNLSAHGNDWFPRPASREIVRLLPLLLSALLLHTLAATLAGQSPASAALPDAPKPQAPPSIGTCQMRNLGAAAATSAIQAAFNATGNAIAKPPVRTAIPCPLYTPFVNWYARFMDGPKVKPLTPKEKAWLAVRNVSDPFNALTILGTSAISVGADSHSAYGPGLGGFGHLVGVSYAEDVTGEFFGTFLIPSIAHQDPHYHREPGASIPHRILHAITQVAWTQGDNGRGMPNYADLVGFTADIAVSNLYVPGRETNLGADTQRYFTGLALAPTDNFITEFLPDLARRIHFRVVLVQRIVDQVARQDSTSP